LVVTGFVVLTVTVKLPIQRVDSYNQAEIAIGQLRGEALFCVFHPEAVECWHLLKQKPLIWLVDFISKTGL